MTVNGKQDDILGYTMDPDGTGNKQSIILLGPMLNLTGVLQMSYKAGTPINTVLISITDSNPLDITTITLTEATVYAIKTYMSTYSNGIFNISSPGNINTELKCKFQKIEIKKGATNSVATKDFSNPIFDAKTTQPWEIHPDAAIKGVGGEISMQIPQ